MIFRNHWAWLGLGAIAVPILIHLLARQASRPLPFPTLRFLRATPLVDVRRRRLTDLLLLAVRIGIIALAVAALAQPFASRSTSTRRHHLVIVDSTESVDGEDAQRAAASYASEAGTTMRIDRRDLRGAMRDAQAWAAATAGEATVVVISDFQRGSIDADAVAGVPKTAGVRLHRVATRGLGTPVMPGVQSVTANGGRTSAAWSAAAPATAGEIRIESGHDAAMAAAILDAAQATAAARPAPSRAATFVLPGAPGRAMLLRESSPPEPWMVDAFASISHGRAETVRALSGAAIVFLATADPAEAADAIREALPALAASTPLPEFEPAALSAEELRLMERAPAPRAPDASAGVWVGRWFWIAALLLLALETLVRRSRRIEREEAARAA